MAATQCADTVKMVQQSISIRKKSPFNDHSVSAFCPIEHLWDIMEDHACAADKSATTAWCYHVSMDNVSSTFSVPQIIKAALNTKWDSVQYYL